MSYRDYRDWLNERKVPKGPWCVNEAGKALNAEPEKAKIIQLPKRMDKSA